MLVPVIRKSLRVTIAILAAIYIVDNVLNQDVKSILLGAGVGGIAIALAAKETIANFFGSITIFADRPFQIDEMIKVGDHTGPVETVGFRSTRIRTLQGHLVTVPNSTIANSTVENIGRRPFIRRTSNITITYGSGHSKASRAVEIIKEVLSDVPEVNLNSDTMPRVYFNEFNDWSLNIYMSYWVRPIIGFIWK
jgi:MscS family membrane protein